MTRIPTIALIRHTVRRNAALREAREVVHAEKATARALLEAARLLAGSHRPDDRLIGERILGGRADA